MNERQESILALLREQKFVGVSTLSALLYTSPSSIRRDLNDLQAKGLVVRSYGGVMLATDHTTAEPLSWRWESNKAQKKRIAEQAATLIEDFMTVFLDSSTTVSFLIDHLSQHKGITVITNNLKTAQMLVEKEVQTYCLGGSVLPSSTAMAGPYTVQMLQCFHADLMFFSSFALSSDGVISDSNPEENAIRRAMLSLADRRVFLCDSSKFDRRATYRLCSIQEIEACFYDIEPKFSE